ncbi:glycosyltransferase [Halorhodospira sp. 9621]|uniref:glycosyltransferase family 2 protein n=1 Tax=Halorhodospira sp. 9621 TaxID=2899135 RepID=UPI001EE9874A|nr:glycosyltransferase family 2 protein [Halorhodospira sp. 9621]MCG5533873.1 glycosyltransferase [Halorhodospira sp. 9621]
MFFSVILPTRDRPQLFAAAFQSACRQDFDDFEILVVDDGSTPEAAAQIRALVDKHPRAYLLRQPRRPQGHGQSYSMNTAALEAAGDYLAFLDDDDEWTDPSHLTQAAEDLQRAERQVDAYYTNQAAFYSDGRRKPGRVWLEDLIPRYTDTSPEEPGPARAAFLTPEELLCSGGFAHLNCSILRRPFYLKLGGMDEGIRYECDRDLYLRTLDQAEHLLYSPRWIARHNIPDPKRADNMSTVISALQKAQYQMIVYQKGLMTAQRPSVREACRLGLGYVYKHAAELLHTTGQRQQAYRYACQGLALHGNLRWAAYTAYLAACRILPTQTTTSP